RAGGCERVVSHPARCAACARADAVGRPAYRPGVRSARRDRARDQRDRLSPRRAAEGAAAPMNQRLWLAAALCLGLSLLPWGPLLLYPFTLFTTWIHE